MKWYSLRVISGKEKVAKENIMFDAEEHNLDEFISEIFVPFEKVIEMKNNKKKSKFLKPFCLYYACIKLSTNFMTLQRKIKTQHDFPIAPHLQQKHEEAFT